MRKSFVHGTFALLVVSLVVATTGGVSDAKTKKMATPTVKSAVNTASITVGATAFDTATVIGKAKKGSPTGNVTFFACGPTSTPTPCTTPNFGPAVVALSPGGNHSSTAIEDITPTSAGWYCFLDEYNGDGNYKPATNNNTTTGCVDATGSTTGPTTPTLTTAVSSSSISLGSSVNDTATLTGTSAGGSPTGTVTFAVCGPTAHATACTSPNAGSAVAQLSSSSNNKSFAMATLNPGTTGFYCFLDTYSGDSHYNPVSDNDPNTECVDVTGSSTGPITPTLTTALSSSSVSLGSSVNDTATVTGTAAGGSPTGTVTFAVCGPTAHATACTSPNAGSAVAQLSSSSNNKSFATATLNPGTTGFYCFLDTYSGDAHYKAVSDNDPSTECVDVTGSSTGPITPTLTTVLSSQSIPFGSTATDTATVTGTSAGGSPTGTLSFAICGPTAHATACTSPNVGPVAAQLSPESGNRAFASGTIDPGAPGWYCFLDRYNGDGHYSAVSDNDTTTECLDVTSSSSTTSHQGKASGVTTLHT
jgi:hypothetical protein